MKQLLLLLIVTWAGLLSAQTVYWAEDFADGGRRWSEETHLCQGLNFPLAGKWTLVSATSDGLPIQGLTATLSFNTPNELTARFQTEDQQYGQVQSRYDLSNNQIITPLTPLLLDYLESDTFSYLNTEKILRWSAHLQISETAYSQWGRVLIGESDPPFQLTDDGLTLFGNDGATELFFQRIEDCGRLWWWHPAGSVRPALFINNELSIASPSAANGAMVLNADYLTTDGNSGPQPPLPAYFSELISPPIDLSAADEKLSLRFHQLVSFANPAPDAPTDPFGKPLRTALRYSLDDGASWSDPIPLNPDLPAALGSTPPPPLNNMVMIPLPAELTGSDQVRLKFSWAGDLFFWAIDDIEILSRPAQDLEIKRSFAAITPNAITPRSQVEAVPWLADIQNNGAATATGVNLNLAIERLADNEVVFSADRTYGPLVSDSLAENALFEDTFDPEGLPAGAYRGRYSLSADQPDAFPVDNEFSWDFALSDTTFAKDLGPRISLTAAENASFIYGNAFYVRNGDGWYARYLSFAVDNAFQLAGQTVTVLLYRWGGDTNGDFLANPSEYDQVPLAANEYLFTGQEGGSLITLPVSSENAGVGLDDDYHYLAMVRFQSTNGTRIFPRFTTDYNYQATWFVTDLVGQTRYAGLLALGTSLSPDFSIAGFGFELVPVVRLSIGQTADLSEPAVATRETVLRNDALRVFPNPAHRTLRIDLSGWPAGQATLHFFDVHGRFLFQRAVSGGEPLLTLDLGAYPAGVYRLALEGSRVVAVKKVLIVR